MTAVDPGVAERVQPFDPDKVETLAEHLRGAPAAEVVAAVSALVGEEQLVVAASMTDAVLLDVVRRRAPGVDVVFVDTGFHFVETLETVAAVETRYRIRVRRASAGLERDERWRHDPDGCCAARKVAPLDAALTGRTGWFSGARRADGGSRAGLAPVELDRRGLLRVHPLAEWSDADVESYIARHDIVVNPLVAQGYPSIGCWPCTRAVDPGEDPRAGRWAGTTKTECGLHW